MTAVWDMPEERAKERGIKTAASARYRDLAIAKEIARELASDGREVWADLVRAELARRHPDIGGPFHFLGQCFRGEEWEFRGSVKSATKGRHHGRICTWRLR